MFYSIPTSSMDYAQKSMAAGTTSNVDINTDMDDVLKRIQVIIVKPPTKPQLNLTWPKLGLTWKWLYTTTTTHRNSMWAISQHLSWQHLSWRHLSILGISQLLLTQFYETLNLRPWQQLQQTPTVTVTFVQATFVQVPFINIKNIAAVIDRILWEL